MNRAAGGIWILVILVAVGAWLAWSYFTRETEPPVTAGTSKPTIAAEAQPTLVEHPVGAIQLSPAAPSTAALPALQNSDRLVSSELLALVTGDDLQALLVSKAVIPRIVATVDALPRKQLALNILPVRNAKGTFQVSESESGAVRAAANDERYAPYIRALAGVDVAATVDWYVRYYPLFQQAYQQLGYPDGYFNDRLVTVIDHLLATPERTSRPVLVSNDKGLWMYADPRLESLSAGQKLMLRAGAEHESEIKQKLRELRALLSGQVAEDLQSASAVSVDEASRQDP